ncbi:MAG: copper transporter [Propionibacteriales bacterium]|nr:copper transporter [Propionibacteriales bacterium]
MDAALTSASESHLLRDLLSDRTVAVFVLPGVARSTVARQVAAVKRAGGLAPVVAQLPADLVDPSKKTYVDSVATSSLKGGSDLGVPQRADSYERIGAVFARAYVGTGNSTMIDTKAREIDAELQGAKLVQLADTPVRRGALVIVLAARGPTEGRYATAYRVIEGSLVSALAARSDGAVLVAPRPTGAARITAGWPPGVRKGVPLATVNIAAGAGSRLAALYALVAAANGHPGDYGVLGGRVRLPPGLSGTGS